MANIGSQGIVKHIDDPSTTILHTSEAVDKTWLSYASSSTLFTKSVAAGRGLHYAGATGGSDGNYIEWAGQLLQFAGQEGHSAVEILVQFSAVTSLAFTFGFNDDVFESSTTLPIELSAAAWTLRAPTFLGFVYDTDANNDELHCYWANSSVVGMTDADSSVDGKTVRMRGIAPVADKWLYLKVEMQDRGSGLGVRATFLAVTHTGASVERVFNTSVDRTTPLCYHYMVESRGVAVTTYMKSPNWEQTIANM